MGSRAAEVVEPQGLSKAVKVAILFETVLLFSFTELKNENSGKKMEDSEFTPELENYETRDIF